MESESETPQELAPSTKETGSSKERKTSEASTHDALLTKIADDLMAIKASKQQSKTKKSRKDTRVRGTDFEVDFPRCDVPEEEAYRILWNYFDGDEYAKKGFKLKLAVKQEFHTGDHGAKGEPHLHGVVLFPEATRLNIPQIRKAMGHQPYVARIKDLSAFLGYISKTGMPTANFDVFAEAWKRSGDRELLIKAMVREGHDLDSIIVENQDKLWKTRWQGLFKAFATLREAEERYRIKKLPGIKTITKEIIESRLSPEELKEFLSFEGYQRLIKHINEINEYQFNQPHQPYQNLLITGKTAIGKSTLMRHLQRSVPTYPFPIDNWHPDYQDDMYTLIIWDEPKLTFARKEEHLLILDGLPSKLPVKGSHAVRKNHQKIIMMSNLDIEKLMDEARIKDADQREAFSRRLDLIDFENRNLDFLQKLFIPRSPSPDLNPSIEDTEES